MSLHELALIYSGFGAGISLTLIVCTWLSNRDHREWCKLVDRQQAIIEELLETAVIRERDNESRSLD